MALCGCSKNNVNVRRIAYPVSLYISKEDDLYQIAILIVNASSLSKIELESGSNDTVTNIYSATGKTFTEAMNSINIEAKKSISVQYIRSVVFNESFLSDEEDLMYSITALFKSPKYRPNIWVFSTNLPFKDLYSVIPNLDLSPYFSLINDPLENEQFALMEPLNLRDILVRYRTGNKMFSIPNIFIDKDSNYSDSDGDPKPLKTYNVSGHYFTSYSQDNPFLTFIKKEDLIGLTWFDNKETINYEIKQNSLRFICELTKTRLSLKGEEVIFDLYASLRNNVTDEDLDEINKLITETATAQINETFSLAKELKIDIFFLERFACDIKKMENYQIKVNLHLDSKIKYQEPL